MLQIEIPEMLKKVLRPIKHFFRIGFANLSFSQEGEDLILSRFFLGQKKGFFIDIGAHHPFKYSNTYLFYRKGWNGINIDPLPNSMRMFNKYRNRDINLEIGISEKEETLNYYVFDEPTLNGFSEFQSKEFENKYNYKLLKVIPIKVYPLGEILEKYCNKYGKIDFMNIDVEGLDLEVLKSNNWALFRPTMILVESHSSNLENLIDCPINTFLKSKGYRIYGKAVLTYFYIDSKYGNTNFVNNL